MRSTWNLDAIGTLFAEAAVDPSRWIAAVDAAASVTGSVGAILLPVRGRGRLPGVPHTETIAEVTQTYLRDGWVHQDERYRAVPQLVQNGVATDFDVLNPDKMQRHPYYQEFLAPFGLRWSGLVKVAAGDDLWVLSIQRSISQGPFSPVEQRRLAELSQSLSGAAALACTLSFARAEGALAAFEVSGSAALLLDREGQVFRANAAAERLLGPDLQVRRKRLTSFDHNASVALDRVLHQLLWTREASALMPPILLPRRDKRPLLAYSIRLASVTADALAACQMIVILVDLDQQPRPPQEHLRTSFGLTAAEARLALRLVAGESLDAAADQLGIAKETSRGQLKAIFSKTGTHRQAELVMLLARLLTSKDTIQPTIPRASNLLACAY
jgi:DNA-binding CsgD family transcriptional regulator/PAS domain-containing protein